jgi:hypothetical protein
MRLTVRPTVFHPRYFISSKRFAEFIGHAPAELQVTSHFSFLPSPETPLILVGRDGRRRVALAADATAQAAGLRVGMPATKRRWSAAL